MPLVKDGALVAEDAWVTLADDTPIPGNAPIIVSLDRWQEDGEALRARNAPLGIRLASDEPPALVADDLAHFDLVALEFPVFGDGRAFSYAHALRERHGFTGEVRAVGDVGRDQLAFMARCGFDAFEIPGDGARALADWRAATSEIGVRYQPAADGRATVLSLRDRRRVAALRPVVKAALPARDAAPAAEARSPAAVLHADDYLASSSLGGYWAY